MKVSSLSDLKHELSTYSTKQLVEVCIRLARLRNENKELLNYLLFEANNEEGFIQLVKADVEDQFREMNSSNLYLAKKSIRKILRTLNKQIRFSGNKKTETELRIHFCKTLGGSGIPFRKSPVLCNLYNNQLKKIESAMKSLHEDLRFDYRREMDELSEC